MPTETDILKRNFLLKGFNFWGIIVCFLLFAFLGTFVKYCIYHWWFLGASCVLLLNHLLIKKGQHGFALIVYIVVSNGLMLMFDDGIMSPSRSFVFYIPLLLSNLLISNSEKLFTRIFPILITTFCIVLTSFTGITPKLAQRLVTPEHLAIISYFNTFMALSITVIVAYFLSRSVSKAQETLIESKLILNQNEKLLESINQNIELGIGRIDGLTHQFIYANNAFIHLFGFTSMEEVCQSNPDLFYADKKDHLNIIQSLRSSHHINNQEILYKRKDGSSFWGLITSNVFVNEEGRMFYDLTVKDISDLKKLREELVEAKTRAEQSSLAKSQFLSTMSHEIRTPMNSVIGASNLLLQDKPSEHQIENLMLIKSAGNNLMRLINNVLDFSKIELDKVEFENVPVDLNLLIHEITEVYWLEAQKKGIKTICNLPELHSFFMIDPIRFSQVLNNLLSNAIKFTEQGTIELTVTVQKEDSNSSTLHFCIKDTGIGIEEDRKSIIFNSFNQESLNTTRKFGGSGLGLAITRKILAKLNTSIHLETAKGKGSTFSFDLKLQKQALNEHSGQVPMKTFDTDSLIGCKILIVEDNEMNTFILKKFLSNWGAECDSCESGMDAIDKLQKLDFDLVFMDLHMPNMDGFQTTEAIRKFNSEIPIIALTADSFSETRQHALQSGMNDFISKPFNPLALFNLVVSHTLQKSL